MLKLVIVFAMLLVVACNSTSGVRLADGAGHSVRPAALIGIWQVEGESTLVTFGHDADSDGRLKMTVQRFDGAVLMDPETNYITLLADPSEGVFWASIPMDVGWQSADYELLKVTLDSDRLVFHVLDVESLETLAANMSIQTNIVDSVGPWPAIIGDPSVRLSASAKASDVSQFVRTVGAQINIEEDISLRRLVRFSPR